VVGDGAFLRPADVRRLLDAHGLAPSKKLGQNFVIDANTVRKVVRDAGVEEGDLVCEIGPGLGSLTMALRAAGAHVVAIEVDAGMVRALEEVVGGDPEVTLVHADALRVDFAALLGPAIARHGPPSLVANLPYNVGTPIIVACLASGTFTRMLVMVQKEVGRRWAAVVGDPLYAAISVKLAAMADVRVVAPVSRTAFYPVPNVDSVTVLLEPRPWTISVERAVLFALVEAGFAQRRKRLRNALTAAGHEPAAVEAALASIGRHAGARAEELDLQQWVALAAALGWDGRP
jgi:16S rRNA (adenine1518-N6/adenine1519-N6)-dimethyltransferase